MRLLLLLLACGFNQSPSHSRVFVTSRTWNGNLSGLAGADNQCEIAGARLAGHFTAWLSAASNDALNRVLGNGPWFLLDGRTAFADRAALASHPAVAVTVDENGGEIAGAERAWTGTVAGGTRAGATCGDWLSDVLGDGHSGAVIATDATWSDGSDETCSQAFHLYCFEK